MLRSDSVPPFGDGHERLSVLVADDDADMRLYLAGCLHGFWPVGLAISEAANGREALLLARKLAFDLIISDIVLPGLSGVALCRALKADPSTAPIPVLLISGEILSEHSCGDAFLAKPFNAAGLRSHVDRLLDRTA